MTQLTLFDTPTNTINNVANVAPVGIVAEPVVTSPTAESPRATQVVDSGGVQRMGDLARLVLMRYELAAQQRELVAKRRAAKQRLANQKAK